MNFLLNIFKIKKTDIKTEIIAGLTTFFTMSYIIIVIPQLLSQAGMPSGAVFTAVLLIVGITNTVMGFFANVPFALAPFMGDVIFITYSLVPAMGYSWQEISAVIFIIGIILFFLTISKFRLNFMDSMPYSIKLSFTAGLGICLLLSGLKNSGLIEYSGNILTLTKGNLGDYSAWLAILGSGFIILLDKLRIKMSVIIGLVILTVIGIILKDTSLPSDIFSLPPSIVPILFKFDFSEIFSQKMITLFFMIFLLINTELHGSVVAVMMKYRENNFKQLKKSLKRTFFTDSVATTAAASLGIPTTGVYADSITGIMAGGKSGLTTVIVGIMFLFAMFISPVFGIFPLYAYAAALLYIGFLLSCTIKEMTYNDISEYISFWLILTVTVFSLNLGLGMAFAFIIYPILKLITKRFHEVPKELLVFTLLSIIFFIIR